MIRALVCTALLLSLPSISLAGNIISQGKVLTPKEVIFTAERWLLDDEAITGSNPHNFFFLKKAIGSGNFSLKAKLKFSKFHGKANIYIGDNTILLKENIKTSGPDFGTKKLGPAKKWSYKPGDYFDFELSRKSGNVVAKINGKKLASFKSTKEVGLFALCPWWGFKVSVRDLTFEGSCQEFKEDLKFKDLFVAGKMGYPRHRIPSISVTNKGTLIAAAEGRQGNDHSQNDILVRRSTDNGNTWEKIIVASDAGKDCLIDTAQIVDRETGRVWIFFVQFANGFHNGAAKAGFDNPQRNRVVCIYSDDDGKSWSDRVDLSRQIKLDDEKYAIFGPGQGIQLVKKNKGRLILAMYGQNKPFCVYSDDHGKTWKRGESADINRSEPQIIERSNGDLMMSVRSKGLHRVTISKDGGLTWGESRADEGLPDPYCQGSIYRYSYGKGDDKGIVLYSSPGAVSGRMRGVVRVSYDDGDTWKHSRVIYPYGFSYSCLTRLPNGKVGLVFEKDGQWKISFCSFDLDWIK